ncbi:MAG: class I SAM-dependent methyltransferase [Burkholderiales bacterium]
MPSPRVTPFVCHHERYERWFEQHGAAYVSELLAVRALLRLSGRGLEIGVGSARFAVPLGVEFGIDPAPEMISYARARGVSVARAVAEKLPFGKAAFDYVLLVTTLCFVENPAAMLAEAHRVLRPDGALVIGFIDRASALGGEYHARRADNVFYRDARFYSNDEVERLLGDAGFGGIAWVQTLTHPLPETPEIESARTGRGQGSFVVVRAVRD